MSAHETGHDIALDDAVPGMVLAADLYDAHGSVLLPAGVALTVANLASLRRRGVDACRIVVADAEEPAAGQPLQTTEQEQERRRLRLARLFRGSAGIGASAVLLQLLLAYRRGD